MDIEAELKKRWPLLLILLFAFSIRTYFANANIAIWWDEAQYMLGARAYARGEPSNVWEGRAFLFPLMLSPFAESEFGAKMLEIFFSLGTITLVYLFCEKYFNKLTAFTASLIMSSMWIDLFYSVRILSDVPAPFFIFLSLFLFLEKGKSVKKTFLSALFFAMAFIIRFPSAIGIFVVVLYGLFTKQYKEKTFYLWFLFLILCISSLFVHDFFVYGDAFTSTRAFIEINLRFDSTGSVTDQPWNFYINILPTVLTPLFLVFTGVGLVLLFMNINKGKSLFLILYLFIFFLALSSLTNKQDRFLTPILPVFSIIGSLGLVKSANLIKKINQNISIGIILILALVVFAYQIDYGVGMISAKTESYAEIKYAGEWIKANSDKDAVIATVSDPQIRYYSDRNSLVGFKSNFDDFISELNNKTVDFYVVSMYEPMPDFMSGDLREYNLTIGNVWTKLFDGTEYAVAIVWVNN
ncbi:MAG: glycosyltransferase family 39 protein [Candidatus Nanoarchaeia archaeon]|nr:glycosyltransferase family 39 protein [Candidatus Nanoarchaeia archaeon]